MTLGDRVVVLHRGEIQQTGAPLELYDRPANRFVAGFLGSPPMNLIDGILAMDDGRIVFRWGDHAVPVPSNRLSLLPPVGTPVTLGIRPEDLQDLRPADGPTAEDAQS
jgi:multiple sugar transport system ATP-binding protein